MKPVGWTFQTPSPSASAAPEDVAELDAGRRRGGPTPTSGEPTSLPTKGAAQGSSETSAAEVNSRINRILMIVKNPSTAKDDGDDGQQRNGKTRRRNGRQGGGGNSAGNWGDTNNGRDNRRGKRGGAGANKSGSSEASSNGKAVARGNGGAALQQRRPAEGTSADGGNSSVSKAGHGRSGGSSTPAASVAAAEATAASSDAGADACADTADPAEGGNSQPTNLNPHAPIFVPNSADAASQDYYGYADANWSYMGGDYWCNNHASDEQLFPEVIIGSREDEFIGLQCIAEMGDWVVLRENKPKCLPFFWNRTTGEKSWEEPPSIKDMGVADLLKKWSVELPESGIEPVPEAWPWPEREREQRRGGGGRRGPGRGSAVASEPEMAGGGRGSGAPRSSAPPGFDGPPATRRREAESNSGAGSAGTGGGSRPSKAGRSGGGSAGGQWRPKALQGNPQTIDGGGYTEEAPRSGSGKDAAVASAAQRNGRAARGAPDLVWQPKNAEQKESTNEPAADVIVQE
mmetsp:Transcript_142172/g.247782  ORF Transcript_142172/g.247782 Transcript_142172/m.247782 type:complete len:516 (+) Transcript_142172:119-1666(+)